MFKKNEKRYLIREQRKKVSGILNSTEVDNKEKAKYIAFYRLNEEIGLPTRYEWDNENN